MEWTDIAPDGLLYSYTVIHAAPDAFAADVPYTICIVDLRVGLRVATRYHGERAPRIGARVELAVIEYDDFCTFGAVECIEPALDTPSNSRFNG